MRFLIAYDRWCLDRVEALLKSLEEWFSISQKRAEQGMIAIYTVLSVVGCFTLKTLPLSVRCESFVVFLGLAWLMYVTMHRRSAWERRLLRYMKIGPVYRMFLQMIILYTMAINLFASPHYPSDLITAAAQLVFLLFCLSTCICSDGKRGRKRKLALAKLKELFGSEWIPKPVSVPW